MWGLYRSDQNFQSEYESRFDAMADGSPEDLLGLQVQLRSVDVDQGFATITVLPITYGDRFGFPMNNGWYPNFPINLQIDSALPQGDSGSNSFYFEVDYQGGFEALLDIAPGSPRGRASSQWYPFDQYHFTAPVGGMYAFPCADQDNSIECSPEVIAEYREVDASVDDGGWANLPVFMHPYLSGTNGFISSMRPMAFSDEWDQPFNIENSIDEAKNGFTSMGISVKRDSTTIFTALAVLALMIATAVSVVIMAIVVASRHRPPTISALVWAAALTFALLQMRNLFPGQPQLGTGADYLVYFPSLLITMACAIWILVMWARRSDWQ